MAKRVRIKRVVYMATNLITGSRYIGATKNGLEHRRDRHYYAVRAKRDGCRVFHAAIRKYGEDAFSWSVLDRASSYAELMDKEIYLIAKLAPEYNITIGGEGVIGVTRTNKWRRKIAKALTGRTRPPEVVAKLKGQRRSEETKAVLREVGLRNKHIWRRYVKLGSRSLRRPIINSLTGDIFPNRREASTRLGVPLARIHRLLNGTYSDLRSLQLRYMTEAECLQHGFKYNPPFVWSEERRASFRDKKQYQCKPIVCLDDNLEFPSFTAAALYYGFTASKGSINSAHNALRKGWRWRGKYWAYQRADNARS